MKSHRVGAKSFRADGWTADGHDHVYSHLLQFPNEPKKTVYSAEFTYVSYVDLRTNSDYFPIQH